MTTTDQPTPRVLARRERGVKRLLTCLGWAVAAFCVFWATDVLVWGRLDPTHSGAFDAAYGMAVGLYFAPWLTPSAPPAHGTRKSE